MTMSLWMVVSMLLLLPVFGCSDEEQNRNILLKAPEYSEGVQNRKILLKPPEHSERKQNKNLLTINKEKWERAVFLDKDFPLPEEEAATFHVGKDPRYGPYLAVGQWRAGKWSARFQYTKKMPADRATMRGLYRTIDINPYEAAVYASYYKSNERIWKQGFVLPPAQEWTPFEVTARHLPPGTESISPGFGLSKKTEGQVFFANLSLDSDMPLLSFPAELPPITRFKSAKKFKRGEFFRIDRDSNKTWWLITPEGEPFYSIGTVGPSFKENEIGFIDGHYYYKLLHEMGFNSLAGWTKLKCWSKLNRMQEKKGKTALPMFYTLSTHKLKGDFDYLIDSYGKTCGKGGHAFPDPFDPRFVNVYREQVARLAKLVRGEKWFIGWFTDNEKSHTDLYRHVYSKYCNVAFRKWLKRRYPSVEALNKAWGTQFKSIDALLLSHSGPVIRKGRRYEDFRQFEQVIVARYVEVTLGAIRTEDPNHLVFSHRFMLSDSSDWLSMLHLYSDFDGIAINLYPSNRVPGLSDSAKLLLQIAHEKTGKPLVISEWSVPALDSGLYNDPNNLDWSFNGVVSTQTDRARQAAILTVDFYNQPYIIGAHWFSWWDYDSTRRQANRGLVKSDGQNWLELQQALKRAHIKLR